MHKNTHYRNNRTLFLKFCQQKIQFVYFIQFRKKHSVSLLTSKNFY